jgi:hypothetical protein
MARFGARRPPPSRELLPLILVVCDDTKTAIAYFAELRLHVKENCTLKVLPAPRAGATANDVIDCAAAHKNLSDPDAATALWAIVDLEMAPGSAGHAREFRKRAQRQNVDLALSQPCFEVWTLAHLVDTGENFDSCDAVLRKLKKLWKSEFGEVFPKQKARADYRKLIDRFKSAIDHAKPRNQSNSQSWTEIWNLGEQILSYLKR